MVKSFLFLKWLISNWFFKERHSKHWKCLQFVLIFAEDPCCMWEKMPLKIAKNAPSPQGNIAILFFSRESITL